MVDAGRLTLGVKFVGELEDWVNEVRKGHPGGLG